ncbi:MAG: DUF2868 domain-containing protein [Verrucomicrobiota bacterium]
MAESQIEIQVHWEVEDLLDLDYFLQQDVEIDEGDLVLRDEKIARDNLLPVLGEKGMVGDASLSLRSHGIWIWLQQRKVEVAKQQGDELSLMPGEVFVQACRIMKMSWPILMMMGAVLVNSLMHTQERYFNVMMFLAATLLPQLFLLTLLVGGIIFRGAMGKGLKRGRLGIIQTLFKEMLATMAGNVLKARAGRAGEKVQNYWQALKQRNYLSWPIAAMTQTLAVWYNIGILAGFAGCMMAMDVRFFWESTSGAAAVETLQQIVRAVSAPWGMTVNDWLPTAAGIAETRITMEGADKIYPPSEAVNSAAVWVPFLAGSVFFWGLLPRLILRIGIGLWGNRSTNRYPFVERRYRELWRRLTALRIEVCNEGPDDEAVVLLWGGLNPDADKLRKVLLQQLRLNPLQTFAAGNETDARADAKRIEQVANKVVSLKAGVRLVVVVESWALAPREATDFLNQLRSLLGQQRAVRLLLLGPPEAGRNFSEPSIAELKVWEDLVSERNDARLTVYPYRKSDG